LSHMDSKLIRHYHLVSELIVIRNWYQS